MLRLFNRLFAKKTTPPARQSGRAQLALESLEERAVPASVRVADMTLFIEADHAPTTAVVRYGYDPLTYRRDLNLVEAELNGVKHSFRGGEGNDTSGRVYRIKFVGGAGADQFFNQTDMPCEAQGGAGNDYLVGGGDYSDLRGGEGDDVLRCMNYSHNYFVSRGYGTFHGEAGNDTIYAGERSTTVYGGEGDDRLYGTNNDDTLYGEGGNDHLYGYDGWDCLYGGEGDDVLYGMGGVDYLYGEGGHDQLFGGDGSDYLWGGWGNDRLHGEGGVDWMWGEDGLDELHGGAETDILSGGRDADRLFGNGGADILNGDEGSDYLDGGLDGYADTLRGGADADVFVLRWSEYDSTDFNYWEYDQWSLHSLWEIQSSVSPSFTSTGSGSNWAG